MEHDPLALLIGRLDAGTASNADLARLEELLASDHEARERFLDHAQIEGILHGTDSRIDGSELALGKLVELQTANVPAPTPPEPRQRQRRGIVGAVAAAIGTITALAVWVTTPGKGWTGTDPEIAGAATSHSVGNGPGAAKTMLSAEERYERSRSAKPGGATQAHPETAMLAAAKVPGGKIEFNRDIRPILSENCFFCHGPDAAERKAGLRFDTEEGAMADLGGYAAIVRGDADTSELVARIFHADADSVMPPPESNRSLSAEEKELLRRWIEEGGQWQRHWAFEPPTRRDPPPAGGANFVRNGIDRFVLDQAEARGLAPSPEADKATLIRRVTLDLTGLPPESTAVDAFLADDSPEAYEKVVDRLLDSDAHAERMAWQWMEAARFADTDGYQNDGPREMWRWRDWVIDAYRANMPFDRFTIEQLAGDLLPDPTRDQLIATGFNRNHRYNSEAGLVLEEFLLENAADRVDTTMTVWMGLTMACARCHDHKYDPLSQRDYFQLVSYFDNVAESGRAVKFGNSEPWIKAPTREQEAALTEIDTRLAEARRQLAAVDEEIAAAQNAWERSDPALGSPLLAEGLSHQFGDGEPILADGNGPVDLEEPVDGLVSNHRFSIALRLTPQQVEEGVVLSNEAPDTQRKGFFVSFHEGRLRFAIVSRWIAGVGMLETLRSFEPGETVHLALTNDGTQRARGMSVYVNGEAVEARTLHNTNSNTAPVKGKHPVLVGGSKHHPSWRGQVDDLRFYSHRTLTAEEISLLAAPGTPSGTLAKAPGQRSEIETAQLRRYFLAYAAPAEQRELVDAIAALEAERVEFEDSLPTTMIMEDHPEPRDTHLRIRGEYHEKGELVSPGIPEAFLSESSEPPRDRLAFAQWLVGDDNPLVARVTVNHYWQMLFGTGLVKTAEDFGTQGSPPSHPGLLDWIALEFKESGWDTRRLLKTLVMSHTYRQSSTIRESDLEQDPENIFLARAPRLKLPGAILRDQALAASGLLVPKIGGPSVKPYQPAGLWREASNFTYKQDSGDALYRRSLYTYWKRTLAPPSMAVLDAADREWCSVKPKRTNTPLQALALMNETAFFEAARKLGEQMADLEDADPAARVRHGFRQVLAREPSPAELDILTESYARYRQTYEANPDEAGRIGATGESPVRSQAPPNELAAATAVANVIFNLEEASVRE